MLRDWRRHRHRGCSRPDCDCQITLKGTAIERPAFMLIIWLQGIWLPLHGYSFAVTPLWSCISIIPNLAGFVIEKSKIEEVFSHRACYVEAADARMSAPVQETFDQR